MPTVAWSNSASRARWWRHAGWSIGAGGVGLIVLAIGVALVSRFDLSPWALMVLGVGGFLIYMSVMTGLRLFRIRSVMTRAPWEAAEFKLVTVAPFRRWPWVVRFAQPPISDRLVEEGWKATGHQAMELAAVGEGWVVTSNAGPAVLAPPGYEFLLSVRPARSVAEEEKWRETFCYPAPPPGESMSK